MNAWGNETTRAALALLALLRSEPSRLDVEVALTARAAVLDSVALVLGDLVPRTREAKTRIRPHVPLHLLERDPVGALAAVLHRRVAPSFDRSPSQLLEAAHPTGSTTDLWAAAGRQALIAGRAWRGPEVRPIGGEEAWWSVAQVSALAEAVAVLDMDVTKACADRPHATRIIDATAGLRFAARATLDLAQQGERTLASVESEGRPPTRPTPDRALRAAGVDTSGSNVPRLAGRLASTLELNPELTPRHVRLTARVMRDLCILTARSAVDPTGANLRAELGDVARALHGVAREDRGERPLGPVSCRAFELALHDLHGAVVKAVTARTTFDPEDATRLARRLPGLVDGLARCTRAEIEGGRWATPDRRHGPHLLYAIASTTVPAKKPRILGHIEEAEAAARTLADRLPDPARRDLGLPPGSATADLAACSRGREVRRPPVAPYAADPALQRWDGLSQI